MNKKLIALLIVMGAVFLGSGGAVLWNYLHPAQSKTVEIVQDSVTLYHIDLNTAKDETLRVDAPDGGYNLITVKNGEISVTEADCHDQTCVHMGVLKPEGLPIVCLPHKLVIRYADGEVTH